MEHTTPAGPSRATRRAHTERLQAFNNAPPASISAPPRGKKSTAIAKSRPDTSENPSETLWHLIADTKGKGKEKAHPDASQSISAAPILPRRRGRPPKIRPSVSDMGAVASLPAESASAPSTSTSTSRLRKRADMPPPADIPPHKKRKTEYQNQGTPVTAVSAPPKRTSGRTRSAHVVEEEEEEEAPTLNGTSLSALARQSSLKRIKLIVRRPPPTVSHPLQCPLPTRFGDSVSAFLASYVMLDDEELDEEALRALAKQDAAAWRDIDRLRAQGRLFRPPDDGELDANAGAGVRTRDAWDAVVDAVKERGAVPFANGQEVAAQVASRVKLYWEAQAVKDDKARAQEERRLRALAKATIRMVAAEWKRAVFVSTL